MPKCVCVCARVRACDSPSPSKKKVTPLLCQRRSPNSETPHQRHATTTHFAILKLPLLSLRHPEEHPESFLASTQCQNPYCHHTVWDKITIRRKLSESNRSRTNWPAPEDFPLPLESLDSLWPCPGNKEARLQATTTCKRPVLWSSCHAHRETMCWQPWWRSVCKADDK